MKRVFVNEEWCLGCHLCEYNCAFANSGMNNMAGQDKDFDNAIPMNSIGFLGLHIMTAGNYVAEKDGGTVKVIKLSDCYKKFFLENGELKGYILVGDVSGGGIYTSLIREKTPLDTLDFDLLTENASLFAFSCETRRKKLGSVV